MRITLKRWRHHLALLPSLAHRGYMVCATSRSGSTYLCQLLSSTGMLGRPTEYFNLSGMRRRHDPTYPSDRRMQLDMIRTRGATANGIYGVKVVGAQMVDVCEEVDPLRDLPNLALIRLQRADLLSQAISLARAKQTGQFYASDRARGAHRYSAGIIRHCLASLRAQNAMWDRILAQHDLRSSVISYEDVLEDPQGQIDRIAALMDLPSGAPIDPALVTLRVQRDQISEEWRQQFLAEVGKEALAPEARQPG